MAARPHELEEVASFWEAASCGENAYSDAAIRYRLEPYLEPFARFADGRRRDVLEIGVGMGADHLRWAEAHPARLVGVDLTPRAVGHTRRRLRDAGYTPDVHVANAEALPFPDASFDIVYSWGVLHHSPDTPRAIREVGRVLRLGGEARLMIYHTWSLVGLMLWGRYALLSGHPFTPLARLYARYLESPGTKAYTRAQAEEMCRAAGFSRVRTRVTLSFGDLLEGAAGQRHQGALLRVARRLWPRRFLRRLCDGRIGLCLLIDATR